MPRTKKTTKPAKLTAEEAAIAARHGVSVVPGSLHYDEAMKKKVLQILCTQCKHPRQIFSQDAFQVRTCGEPACKRAWKKSQQ